MLYTGNAGGGGREDGGEGQRVLDSRIGFCVDVPVPVLVLVLVLMIDPVLALANSTRLPPCPVSSLHPLSHPLSLTLTLPTRNSVNPNMRAPPATHPARRPSFVAAAAAAASCSSASIWCTDWPARQFS